VSENRRPQDLLLTLYITSQTDDDDDRRRTEHVAYRVVQKSDNPVLIFKGEVAEVILFLCVIHFLL